MGCSGVPSNSRRDVASRQWEQERKEEALGSPQFWSHASAARKEDQGQDPPRRGACRSLSVGCPDDIRRDRHNDVWDMVGWRMTFCPQRC